MQRKNSLRWQCQRQLASVYLLNLYDYCSLNDTHMEDYALLNSVQKFIEIQGWLLLTFVTCLQNQLSSFNSIIVQMSENRDS